MAHLCSNQALGCFLLVSIAVSSLSTISYAHFHNLDTREGLSTVENVDFPPTFQIGGPVIGGGQETSDVPPKHEIGEVPPKPTFENGWNTSYENKRLKNAYVALQAWKEVIYSDPLNTTGNWIGRDVCSYKGVFCAPALNDPTLNVVAGVDLNHADIAGHLPEELGLLKDVALFHINSNRFCGIVPQSLKTLSLMHEFDISNNRFVGGFPVVVLAWPTLKYLDIRFNDFEGFLPPQLFEKELDAIFLNNNRFTSTIPETIGKSKASVITFANNNFTGCIPKTIGSMVNLDEIVFLGNGLGGCLPREIGLLGNLRVLDASNNGFVGTLPHLSDLKNVEVIDIAHNKLSGYVSNTICQLPSLKNFTFSDNYLNGEGQACMSSSDSSVVFDDSSNCLPGRKNQKGSKQCLPVLTRPVDCSKHCGGGYGKSNVPSTPKPAPSISTPVRETPKSQPPKHETPQTPKTQPPPTPKAKPPPTPKTELPTQSPPPPPTSSPPPPVHFPPPPIYSPPPPTHSLQPPPPLVYSPSPTPLVHSPPPPPPTYSPPPPVHSPPPPSPPPPIHSPPTPVHSSSPPTHSPPPLVHSSPPPINFPPPSTNFQPPPPSTWADVILPPIFGAEYSSPPPPAIVGY